MGHVWAPKITEINCGCLLWKNIGSAHLNSIMQKGGTLKENCTSLSTYLTYEVTALGLKCRWKLPYCGILVLWREKGKHELLLRTRRHFHCLVFCCFNATPDSTGGQNLVHRRRRIRSVYIKEAGMWLMDLSSAFQSSHSNAGSIIYSTAERGFCVFLQTQAIFWISMVSGLLLQRPNLISNLKGGQLLTLYLNDKEMY